MDAVSLLGVAPEFLRAVAAPQGGPSAPLVAPRPLCPAARLAAP
jgi:hypothetical protein